jgi:homoaconitase/3-isopropylmalate dehydratase large subunit
VTWGTSPEDVLPITGVVPAARGFQRRRQGRRLRAGAGLYGPEAGQPLTDIADRQRVFIGSCTNGRIEDLRAAAASRRASKVAAGVRAMVVPAPAWCARRPKKKASTRSSSTQASNGASRLLDVPRHEPRPAAPGERCASTSNRNFEGRQGRGGRTHLMSPAMAAAAAITGHLTRRARRMMGVEAPREDMDKFTTLTGIAAPMPLVNIDTDMIIPKQFLKTIQRSGLGKNLFDEMRYTARRARRSPISC